MKEVRVLGPTPYTHFSIFKSVLCVQEALLQKVALRRLGAVGNGQVLH